MIPAGIQPILRTNLYHRRQLLKYGFESLDEYNSFRYSDYCFKKFMEAAERRIIFTIPFLFLLVIMAWPEMLKPCIRCMDRTTAYR